MIPGRQRIAAALLTTCACVLATGVGLTDSTTQAALRKSVNGSAFVPGDDTPFGGLGAGAVGRGEVVGTLFFSEDSNANGLYVLDQIDGTSSLVGASGVSTTTVGLAPSVSPEEIFGSRPSGLLRIQTDGSGSARTGSLLIEGMAYNRLSRRLYGTANRSFFRVDPVTGAVAEMLTSPGVELEGLAYAVDPFGRRGVYGLVGFGGTQTALYFYDLDSMTWSVQGDTGIDWSHVGLAYDECNKVLYAKGSQDNMLYRLIPNGFSVEVEAVGATGISRGGGLAWVGECPGPPCPDEDINKDGIIGFADILLIISAYGECAGGACTKPGSCEGGFVPGCGGDPECACVELFDGTLVCHSDFGCGDPCPDGTCPPGFHCVRNSCCGPFVCAPDEALCGEAGDPCTEDLDGDGVVGFADILRVLSLWGPCTQPVGACCLPKAGCVEDVTRTECDAMQGDYLGDGTNCDADGGC